MERLAMQELIKWKGSKHRKPLILKGARQVGKTWLLKEFGTLYYENVAYFNFDESPEYRQFFETTKDVDRILENLIMISGQKIYDEKTLIIFDEIQECPQALNTLKYFYENKPCLNIACAGSLLGISLAKPAGFPVGKVDFLDISPLTFSEFLLASGHQNYFDYLQSINSFDPIVDAVFNPLSEKLKMYFITGGMPEAVRAWTKEKDINLVERVLYNIINAYEFDFSKHHDNNTVPKISLIWNSIPSQLAKENKKFLYKTVKEGARAREYEDALQWLNGASLVHKIYRCNEPHLPLSAYDDISAFKIYLNDVGILRKLAHLSPNAIAEGNRLFIEFKGSLAENYVLSSLKNQFELTPRYWAMDKPRYEVDFLIQNDNTIFPIEVKSSVNIESKSLKKYAQLYSNSTNLRIRFSLRNLTLNDNVLNIPLFMADQTSKLLRIFN